MVLTSNRTRDLHDALKRRCLYHWIDYPAPERTVQIVRRRAPGSAEPLAVAAAAAVARIRTLELEKPPGIAEAIDWVAALTLLGVARLDPVAAASARSARCSRTGPTRSWSAGPACPGWSAPPRLVVARRCGSSRRGWRRRSPTGLRRAGVPATPDRAARFARVLALLPPTDADRLYWAARLAFVADRSQLPAFDRVFAAVFGGAADLADSRGDPTAPPSVRTVRRSPPVTSRVDEAAAPPRPSAAGSSATPDGAAGAEPAREAVLAAAAPDERLRHTAFTALTAAEIDAARRLARGLALATPPRRTRRTRRSRRAGDRVDLRRSVRRAQRTAGDPVRLVRRRRRTRPRRLVLLCDVSASMEPYTRVFLTLLHGAVLDARAEAFVFATRLTRLTRALHGRDPDAALGRAAATAPDWAGGTRLGESLRRFVTEHGRRGIARGAVVVIVSDGWEGDDPRAVAEQMARLRRLAHRIVWVNPRSAAVGFAPLVGGMAAALPYCDTVVSGHTVAALAELVAAVREDRGGTR